MMTYAPLPSGFIAFAMTEVIVRPHFTFLLNSRESSTGPPRTMKPSVCFHPKVILHLLSTIRPEP
jgi:hypothetical protein